MAKLCIGDIPVGAMNWVVGPEIEKTKFGATIDTLIGDVENGVLQAPASQIELNFAGVREVGEKALYYRFYGNLNITAVDLSSLTTVGNLGLYYAFYGCKSITGTLDLSSLQSVGSNGMNYAFYNCSGITGVLDLSSLESVGFSGLSHAFCDCMGITGIDLSSLQSVGDMSLWSAFSDCDITTISFPSLTSVHTDSFRSAFQYCGGMTEIHFRADMQATIEACNGYASKFGATNATIYFDL